MNADSFSQSYPQTLCTVHMTGKTESVATEDLGKESLSACPAKRAWLIVTGRQATCGT